jgi:uncharacterized repeat protein (TIGR01451 family)
MIALDSILKRAKIAVTSIAARVLVAFVALALSGSDGFAFGAKPDLAVTVFAAGSDRRPVTAPGQPFSFMIGLGNMKGVADAHHIQLTAVLPKGLKFQNSDPPPTRLDSGYNPVWEIDTLRAKALPRLFEVTAQTDSSLFPGSQLEISAKAESNESNANSTDNHSSYTIYVQSVGAALVFLGSTLDSVLLTTDGPTTFQINLRNAGNLPATNTLLQATLPKEVKFDKADPQPASSSGQLVTLELGDLARGESRSVTMTVALDPHQVSDVLQGDRALTFDFKVSGAGTDGKVTSSNFEITKHIEPAGQDVAVWLTTEGAKEPGEVSPKDNVTCVIKCANLGNQPAHKVVVTLNLGSGLGIVHSDPQPSGTGTNHAYPGGVAHWDIGDLDVGMSRTIRSDIHVTSVSDDGALVEATISGDGTDIDGTNNSAFLLWRSPLSPGALRRSAAIQKTIGGTEETSGRPASHRLRHFFELILLIVVVLIVVRARRGPVQ